MKALYLKELRSFLGSIIGYIFMAIFLVANSLFLWVFSGETNVFEGGTADLRSFFVIAPLILCVLVPAITMRSFSEEQRTGTIELLFTKPISDFSIILSKYLAGVTLVVISILPTLIYLICIHVLGETLIADGGSVVDDAATTTSYIGLALVGACFVAVGVFASTITSSQIVSFIISMFLCWFLFFGFDLLAVYSEFGSLDALLRNIGFMEHYQSIQKGVIDLRDVVFFFSVIAFFLILTTIRLGARKRLAGARFFDIGSNVFQLRLVILGLLLGNYILGFSIIRWDLTADKRHSLSDNTIAMLQDEERMKDRIFFKIYLDGELPADFKKMRDAIQEKLDEFSIYAGDKIQYEFIDPNGDADEDYNIEVQKMIYSEGVDFCDLKIRKSGKVEVKTIWPGALIDYKGTTVDNIQFFNRNSIEPGPESRALVDQVINNLEYNLISAIRRVTTTEKKTIAFLHGHGELSEWQTMDVRSNLKRYYYLDDLEINGDINALNDVDALVVAGPRKRFTEKDKFVIDQFIMRGGTTMWFIDPLEINRDSLFLTGQTYGIGRDLNIEKDMLFKYGVRLNSDVIIDETCGPMYVPGHPLEVVDWYFYPLLERKVHPISKNLDPIKSEYPASLQVVNENDPDVTKTVLLKSSANSRIFKSPARINYSIIDIEPNFSDGTQGDYSVAVLMEGRFKSPFENRISDAFLSSKDYKTRFFSDSTRMLVASDADLIRNEVDSALFEGEMRYRAIPLSVDPYGVPNENGTAPKYTYGNRDFVLNAIDYMLDENSLIDIRNKTVTQRLLNLDKVADNKEFWKFLNIAMPLILVFVFAIIQTIVRRRRYAK